MDGCAAVEHNASSDHQTSDAIMFYFLDFRVEEVSLYFSQYKRTLRISSYAELRLISEKNGHPSVLQSV